MYQKATIGVRRFSCIKTIYLSRASLISVYARALHYFIGNYFACTTLKRMFLRHNELAIDFNHVATWIRVYAKLNKVRGNVISHY